MNGIVLLGIVINPVGENCKEMTMMKIMVIIFTTKVMTELMIGTCLKFLTLWSPVAGPTAVFHGSLSTINIEIIL